MILHEDQRLCSDLFASKSSNKFDDVEWSLGPTGAPGIAGSLAVFDCTKSNVIKAGDHIVLIGEVASFKSSAGRPLVYGQGGYISVSVQQAAVARSPGRNVVVGCVVDYEGSVFLNRTQQGKWRLPEAIQRNETTDELRTLNSALKDMGATVEITFLYSVYDIASENAVAIVYRGTLSELPEKSGHARLYAESQIPWDDIEPKESKEVLQRFFTDLRLNQFSIYSDVLNEPRVAHLQPDPPRSWDNYVSEVGSKSERPA